MATTSPILGHFFDTIIAASMGGGWPPDRAVWVRALARDTVLCSWERHLTLTVLLYSQESKWVPANCWRNLTNCGGVTYDGLASCSGGVEILLAASCYRNLQDKLRVPVGRRRLFQQYPATHYKVSQNSGLNIVA